MIQFKGDMGCFVSVPQSTVGILEEFGKFDSVLEPGCHIIYPYINNVAFKSLRVLQLDVSVETKTSDNVFVHITVSVQYEVVKQDVVDAHYKLQCPKSQISSYVFDVVRSTVPNIILDEVFSKKDEIAVAVKNELQKSMDEFGFNIVRALVTNIEPDEKVKKSMNEINAAQRMRVAAADKAEAEKILKVKLAEADAEAKHLAGQGVAKQRKAIVDGLRDSVLAFSDNVQGTTPQQVMDLVMMTQYFDTMRDISGNSKSSTVFMPHNPGSVADVASQIRNGFMTASAGMTKDL